jgi:hypothetical protein
MFGINLQPLKKLTLTKVLRGSCVAASESEYQPTNLIIFYGATKNPLSLATCGFLYVFDIV